MMRIGCQIGSIQAPVEEAAKLLHSLGIRGMEIFVKHIEPFYGRPKDFLAALEPCAAQISGAYFTHDGLVLEGQEEEALAAGRKAIDFLHEIGASCLVVNGGVTARKKPEGFDERDFAQLGDVLNRLGEYAMGKVGVVIHPHIGETVVTLPELDRLFAYVDSSKAGVCLHANHQLLADSDYYGMYEKYGRLVRYLHIGDAAADKKGEFLGQGIFDQARMMKPILDAGYSGWIIIECRKDGVGPQEYVGKARDYLVSQGWARP